MTYLRILFANEIDPITLFDNFNKTLQLQVHPHLHAVLGKGEYLGKYLHMDHVAKSYGQATNGRTYLNDYVDAHVALGLGIRVGSVAVVSPLGIRWKQQDILNNNDNIAGNGRVKV